MIREILRKIINFRKWFFFKRVEKNTMVGHDRLYNLYNLCNKIEGKKAQGAFVECGVWKGGAAAVMAYVSNRHKSGRKIWLFDSFEGLPEPGERDGAKAKAAYEKDKSVASVEDVEDLFFEKLNFKKQDVNIVKGWFDKTLPLYKDKIGPIAVLRLDGDWYESTKTCLENLYDNVIEGGYIVIDDYGSWSGCKTAVDEFLSLNNIEADLIPVDKSGYYFQKKSQMKVGLMTYSFDNRPAKGSALYAKELTKELLKDESIDCYLIHYKKTNDPIYLYGKEIIMPKVRFPYGSQFISQLLFFWRYRKDKFDIIHWFQPRVYPFYWLAPTKNIVVTLFGGGKYYYPKWDISARIFDLMIRRLNWAIDAAIGGTIQSSKEIIETYNISLDRVYKVYLGGGENFQCMKKKEAQEKINRKYSEINGDFILNISRLQPHKNVTRLIQAYELLRENNPDIKEKLVIVGKPTSTYVEEYEVAKASKFSSDIMFIDFVEQDDLNAIYSGAKVFVFPSLNEGFGLPVVEAMASGTPVVTSNIASLPEVSGGAAILVDPFNIQQIAEGIKQVISDEELRGNLIRKGLERSKEFTWERTANETKKIYKKLLKSYE